MNLINCIIFLIQKCGSNEIGICEHHISYTVQTQYVTDILDLNMLYYFTQFWMQYSTQEYSTLKSVTRYSKYICGSFLLTTMTMHLCL
jgi:hypothetical protein